jgi:hypothetical protein
MLADRHAGMDGGEMRGSRGRELRGQAGDGSFPGGCLEERLALVFLEEAPAEAVDQ